MFEEELFLAPPRYKDFGGGTEGLLEDRRVDIFRSYFD